MKNVLRVSMAVLFLLGIVSCNNDKEDGTAQMSVTLTDAPGNYDAVYIDVQDVVIKYNGSNDEVPIGEINAGVYNLLDLTGGVSVLLVEDEIPAGMISQIRLILGSNNSIVVDGETFPLDTPSAQQSGLKIQVNETVEAGIFYEFILDFVVDESIVEQGNGGFILKPVIRATTVAETGAISGMTLPLDVQTLVTATDGVYEISAYTDMVTGAFLLSGVPEGTYTVTVEADPAAGLPIKIIEDVNVIIGQINDLGTIDLNL